MKPGIQRSRGLDAGDSNAGMPEILIDLECDLCYTKHCYGVKEEAIRFSPCGALRNGASI